MSIKSKLYESDSNFAKKADANWRNEVRRLVGKEVTDAEIEKVRKNILEKGKIPTATKVAEILRNE